MAAGDPGTLKRNYSATAAATKLSVSIPSATQGDAGTITVNSVAGFPSTFPYSILIDIDTSKEEVLTVTGSNGSTTLNVVRGQDNTQAYAHQAGVSVRHGVSAREFTELQTHIAARGYDADSSILANVDTHVHGIAAGEGDVVGTAKTQTLTNKTIGSTGLHFEGATNDTYETTLTVADPTADNTITLPNTTGTVAILDAVQTLTNKTLTSPKVNENVAVTATATELNILDGATLSTAELNLLDGATLTTTELNYVDGVTSAIQTQLDGKQAIVSGVSSTEIGYLDGVTSAIQTQLDDKAPSASPTFTGTVTLPTSSITSANIADGTIVNADISGTAGIAYSKLSLGGSITSADIVDGTIVASDIANGTITAAKMVSDPYARANHTGSQVASTISDLASTVKAYTLDEFADPVAAISMNSQKITTLATPTDNADAATKLYVDTKVADLVNSAPSTLDTLGEIANAIQSGGTVYESFVLKAGSTMTGALTLSGAPTVDLHAATKAYVDTVAGSATAAAASAAAAAASYDSFDDRYLGSKSTPPTLDNDGNALIVGALYWNSVDNAMYAWTGTEWGSISSTAEIYRFRFTASGGETSVSGTDDNGLTLSYLPGKEQVYLNGVLLARTSDYTASNGTSITSLAALAASDIVEIITFTSFEVADAIARTVFDAKGDLLVGTAADTVGKLTLGTNGYVLKANSATATGLEWGQVDLSPYATTTNVQTANEEQNIMTIMGAY